MIIEVSIRGQDSCEDSEDFTDPKEAETYFYKLVRKRTRFQLWVQATVDGEIRIQYHITDEYAGNRWQISTELETGLAVKRRYIASTDELTGRKPKIQGRKLPPIMVPTIMYAQLVEKADRAGIPLSVLRREAYQKVIDESDTILSEIVT